MASSCNALLPSLLPHASFAKSFFHDRVILPITPSLLVLFILAAAWVSAAEEVVGVEASDKVGMGVKAEERGLYRSATLSNSRRSVTMYGKPLQSLLRLSTTVSASSSSDSDQYLHCAWWSK